MDSRDTSEELALRRESCSRDQYFWSRTGFYETCMDAWYIYSPILPWGLFFKEIAEALNVFGPNISTVYQYLHP